MIFHFLGKSVTYLDTILQLLEDENAHKRDTIIDRVHEFVILAQGIVIYNNLCFFKLINN